MSQKILINIGFVSANNGKLDAITMYGYQQLEIEYPELAESLLEISMVEMHHLNILGTLIKQLGKNPLLYR